MNVKEVNELFEFNALATNKFFETISQIPAEQYRQDMKSSHGGIHGTMTHIIGAQKMWLSRWSGTPDKALIQPSELPSLADLQALWNEVQGKTISFIATVTDEKLEQTIIMTTTKGDTYIHTYSQMILHLINHSSYHRGQVATLLRQIGVKPPQTDLIAFHRQKPLTK